VPLVAVQALSDLRTVAPGSRALETSQDRGTEKQFFVDLGLSTAPFRTISDLDELRDALGAVGAPAILKTRRFGYDGKGQVRIDHHHDAEPAWEAIGKVPAILEGRVDFDLEVSVIAARSFDGGVVCYDPGENVHQQGILRTTRVPARISPSLARRATGIAGQIADALNYVGVLGVELFVVNDELLVNEIAPRVHNSGHWTQNGCVVDQFEQHIRAILGRPLGDGRRYSDVIMTNLIGEQVEHLDESWSDPDTALHLYGKHPVLPDRKMGHLNRIVRRV
jgi:5-(carboxyamino)imidazole ribonucleotide synthase